VYRNPKILQSKSPQGLTTRDLPYICWAALPYFLPMCVAVILIWYFPQIATWLPAQMTGPAR
jgi:TRAP-type C4-dicarboxylate transport system permease large subunit